VRAACERYGIPYNAGPPHRQFGSVVRKIVRLSLPPLRSRREEGSEEAPDQLAPALVEVGAG
jgi:NADPH-dependent stearoyl-CoA 9-desaturase